MKQAKGDFEFEGFELTEYWRNHGVSDSGSPKIVGIAIGRESQPTLIAPPVVETDFAELANETLLETIEGSADSSRSLLAIHKDGKVRLAQRHQSRDRILVPVPWESPIIKHVRLPRGAEAYGSVRSLFASILWIISQGLDLNANSKILLSRFDLSTSLIDRLPVAPAELLRSRFARLHHRARQLPSECRASRISPKRFEEGDVLA
jgi:hypothetical protein